MTKEETHNQTLAVLFSDDVRSESGRAFGREFRTRIPDARVIYVDPRIAGGITDEVLKAVDEAQTVVAAVYVIPSAGKMGNSVAMADATGTLLQQLLTRCSKNCGSRDGESVLGGDFTKIENYICTFSNATVIGACSGEGPIRRDPDSGASSRHHSKYCGSWSRAAAPCSTRQRRNFSCAQLNLRQQPAV